MSNSHFIKCISDLEQGLPAPSTAGFLGVDFSPDDCQLLLLPVPWEATTSYGGGTSRGPSAMLPASHQLDLEDAYFGKSYRSGISFLPQNKEIDDLNSISRSAALRVIEAVSEKQDPGSDLRLVNDASDKVNQLVYEAAKKWIDKNKFLGVVGGDHSSPFGLIQALSERYREGFGILHFDAHHDLRNAYEGFKHSHASIFYNVMESFKNVKKLVQVAIRDYSREERQYMQDLGDRGNCFYSKDIFAQKAEGVSFKNISDRIIDSLPQLVYVSFDIDGLDPSYCPSTGTPVPGGLSFEEACYILERLGNSGKKVIGFDLCEVTPGADGDEWDANVGARMLYKLCGCLLRSQRLC